MVPVALLEAAGAFQIRRADGGGGGGGGGDDDDSNDVHGSSSSSDDNNDNGDGRRKTMGGLRGLRVLDVCASPGSKTTQLLQCVLDAVKSAAAAEAEAAVASSTLPSSSSRSPSKSSSPGATAALEAARVAAAARLLSGCAVVANDCDRKRAATLSNRVAAFAANQTAAFQPNGAATALSSSSSYLSSSSLVAAAASSLLLVTNHDATKLPVGGHAHDHHRHDQRRTERRERGGGNDSRSCSSRSSRSSSSSSRRRRSLAGTFDAVVVDVPCSGDGTVRKDLSRRLDWTPSFGAALHRLQLRIALRAAVCLKVGGAMTYSTCSLHPLEDEAVVAALLHAAGGALQVLDANAAATKAAAKTKFGNAKAGGGCSSDIAWGDAFTAGEEGILHWPVLDDDLQTVAPPTTTTTTAATRSPSTTVGGGTGGASFSRLARATMWPPSGDAELNTPLPAPQCTSSSHFSSSSSSASAAPPPPPPPATTTTTTTTLRVSLRRCIRVVPSLRRSTWRRGYGGSYGSGESGESGESGGAHDTGGFFVCLLRKVAPLPIELKSGAGDDDDDDEDDDDDDEDEYGSRDADRAWRGSGAFVPLYCEELRRILSGGDGGGNGNCNDNGNGAKVAREDPTTLELPVEKGAARFRVVSRSRPPPPSSDSSSSSSKVRRSWLLTPAAADIAETPGVRTLSGGLPFAVAPRAHRETGTLTRVDSPRRTRYGEGSWRLCKEARALLTYGH